MPSLYVNQCKIAQIRYREGTTELHCALLLGKAHRSDSIHIFSLHSRSKSCSVLDTVVWVKGKSRLNGTKRKCLATRGFFVKEVTANDSTDEETVVPLFNTIERAAIQYRVEASERILLETPTSLVSILHQFALFKTIRRETIPSLGPCYLLF